MSSLNEAKQQLKENVALVRTSPDEIMSAVPILQKVLAQIRKNNHSLAEVSPLLKYILQYLCYSETQAPALLVVIHLNNTNAEGLALETEDLIEDMATTAESRADSYRVVQVLSEFYTILPNVCSLLFTKNDAVVKLLANEIAYLLSSSAQQLALDGAANLRQVLSLFSNACIDQGCRKIIAQMYMGLLIKTLKQMDGSVPFELQAQCIAATVIIKVWSSVPKEEFQKEPEILSLEYLTEVLINGFIQGKQTTSGVEGLAFLSLNVGVKKALRMDDNFITCLLDQDSMDNRDVAYGVLCIVANLTQYNPILSKQQQSLQSLQNYANLSNIDPKTGKKSTAPAKDSDEEIAQFVTRLVNDKNVVARVKQALTSSSTRGILAQGIRVLGNLCYRKEHRSAVVKHGGLSVLLSYLTNTSEGIKYVPDKFCQISKPVEDPETRLVAIEAVARIVMGSNPNALFFQKNDILTPVPFLLEEVVKYDNDVDGTGLSTPLSALGEEAVSHSDCFEALIALVNLTSVDNMQLRELVLRLAWPAVQNLMLCANPQIQRADLELVSNLMLTPHCSEKFFNWNSQDDDNYKNFRTLCQLTSLSDLASQTAVLNIFANCSGYEMIAKILAESELFQTKLAELIEGQSTDEDILLRCLYIILNLQELLKPDCLLVKRLHSDLKGPVVKAAVSAKDPEVRQMAAEVVRMK